MARISKRAVRLAIEKKKGVVVQIAEELDVSRQTVYSYLKKYDLWGELVRDRGQLCDLAENNIANAIEAGDVDTSKWVLSRLGKARGYGDKIEVEGALPLSADVIAILQEQGKDLSEVARQFEMMVRARAAMKPRTPAENEG